MRRRRRRRRSTRRKIRLTLLKTKTGMASMMRRFTSLTSLVRTQYLVVLRLKACGGGRGGGTGGGGPGPGGLGGTLDGLCLRRGCARTRRALPRLGSNLFTRLQHYPAPRRTSTAPKPKGN